MDLKIKIPTEVPDFDSIVKGGLPNGSMIILTGEPGAGALEFALTSAIKLSDSLRENKARDYEKYGNIVHIPKNTHYISFSRSREEIERNIDLIFDQDFISDFKKTLIFKDFSRLYFKRSKVPKNWIGEKSTIFKEERDLLSEFVDYINENGDDSIVIIDSLTDLIISPYIEQSAVIDIIKGLQRFTKSRNGITYLMLAEAVVDKRLEAILYDTVDGVIVFRWQGYEKYYIRSRYMYVLKFNGVLSHLEEEKIVRFDTSLNNKRGFVVVDTERIR